MRTTSAAIVLSALLLARVASADVILKMRETTDLGSKKPKVSTGSWVLGADRLAIRWDDPSAAGHSEFIFRGDKELIWVVDDQTKSYEQIDKAFIDQMSAQVTAAKAEMQARIDALPADQRAQAEEMMKKYAGGMQDAVAAMKPEYRKMPESKVINGHACTKVDVYSGDDLTAHAWVAPYADLGLAEKDGAVFEKMSEFVARLTGPMATLQKKDYIPMHELGGVPLLSQDVDGDQVTTETRVDSVTRGAAPAGSFDVPAGYKLKPMPSVAHKK